MTSVRIRRRWIAVVLAFFLMPFFGMLYLGKGWRALIYLMLIFGSVGLALWLAAKGFWYRGADWSLIAVLVAIAGTIDSYRIARQHKSEFNGPWYSRWYGLTGLALSMVLVVLFTRAFIIEPFRLPANSMAPGILAGDFIVVNKFAYGIRLPLAHTILIHNAQPARGDVLIFRYPEKRSLTYIKRVIGVPGDIVVYRDKRLRLNGKDVQTEGEDVYLSSDALGNAVTFARRREYLNGHPHSILIDPDAPVIQLAGVREFPHSEKCSYDAAGFTCTVPPGHYLVLGDNRDRSSDSRYWGFVPEANVVGKAVMIWWNEEEPQRTGLAIS